MDDQAQFLAFLADYWLSASQLQCSMVYPHDVACHRSESIFVKAGYVGAGVLEVIGAIVKYGTVHL